MDFVAQVQESKAKVKNSFIGHKDKTFDVRLSAARKQLLSASEDGSCKVWDQETHKCSLTIVHNKAVEVLRAAFLDSVEGGICTAGADGNAIIWREEEEGGSRKARKVQVLEHGAEAQLYACETMHKSSDLLVAADNRMFIWDLNTFQPSRVYQFNGRLSSSESFGGHRNPENEVYMFDAKSQPESHCLVGAAMSDSTVRLIDTRCADQASAQVVTLDLQEGLGSIKLGHATSVSHGSRAAQLTPTPFRTPTRPRKHAPLPHLTYTTALCATLTPSFLTHPPSSHTHTLLPHTHTHTLLPIAFLYHTPGRHLQISWSAGASDVAVALGSGLVALLDWRMVTDCLMSYVLCLRITMLT
jgi:hypothetical protein